MRPYILAIWTSLLLLTGLFGGELAHAQQPVQPRQRQGYYLSLGFSGTLTQMWPKEGDNQHDAGLSNSLRFGEMVTEHFGLGLRIGGNFGSQLTVIGLEGQWEFAPNFALRAGAGLGIAVMERADPNDKQKGTVGGGYSLGLSYDWFIGVPTASGGFALTPALELRYVPGSKVSALAGLVGVSITYFTGLPRDQLVLPESEAYRPR